MILLFVIFGVEKAQTADICGVAANGFLCSTSNPCPTGEFCSGGNCFCQSSVWQWFIWHYLQKVILLNFHAKYFFNLNIKVIFGKKRFLIALDDVDVNPNRAET